MAKPFKPGDLLEYAAKAGERRLDQSWTEPAEHCAHPRPGEIVCLPGALTFGVRLYALTIFGTGSGIWSMPGIALVPA